MVFISVTDWNKYLIFPLIGGINKLIINIIIYILPDKIHLDDHPFCSGINAGLGMSLAFIPYLIISKCPKNENNNDKITFEKIDEETKKSEKNIDPDLKKGKYLIIFLCSFLDFLQKILVFMFSSHIFNNIWLFNIFFLYLFSLMVDKFHLYKHHYLSGGIMIFFGIGLNVINLLNIKVNQIPYLFLSIFIEMIYSLCIILAKNGISYKFCSPFEITIYEGIFSLVLNIIFLAISTNIPLSKYFKFSEILKVSEYNGNKYLDNFYSYFPKMGFTEILSFIVIMIGRVSFNLFTHLTLKHFDIFHVIFILIIGEIQLNWEGKTVYEIVITAVIFAIELFMLLIFCEILELNFCGLDDNIKKNRDKLQKFIVYDDDSKDSKEIYKVLDLDRDVDTDSKTINSYLGV